MSDDVEIIKIKGKLMWAKLFHPDTKFGDKWITDVLLDATEKAKAESLSLRVKHKEDYADQFEGYDGSYLQLTRNTKKRDGEEMDPPKVVDKDIRDVPSSTGIGNGTDAYVRFMKKTRDMTGKVMSPAEAMAQFKGYGGLLTGVQILNLVPYENASDPDTDFIASDEGDFSVEGDSGFKVEKKTGAFDDDDLPF